MSQLLPPDEIRGMFSLAMSDMYRREVPQYGTLCELVGKVNAQVLRHDPALADRLRAEGQLERLDVERHGAVRVATAQELATLRRLFAVMGMQAVGYYDLSIAGVPVHATAFRPVYAGSLEANPFRVFTSLLRLELIADPALRQEAAQIVARRRIFTSACLDAIERAEKQGGLTRQEADAFVTQALETFRWHSEATVELTTYRKLRAAHPLVADIVCFKGPHINHLTPRTLDIDAAQAGMPETGIEAKKTIEGPPPRAVPILLRQTSFLALEEPIHFVGATGDQGTHTARFGEIEQRGCALTRKGRALYDALLSKALAQSKAGTSIDDALRSTFGAFPDDEPSLRQAGLAFFTYEADVRRAEQVAPPTEASVNQLVEGGWLRAKAVTYEDFLPVSAAGIFRSNLGGDAQAGYQDEGNREAFESALGAGVLDEIDLYQQLSDASLRTALAALSSGRPVQVTA
ncbi:VOC family protein [Variovorax sp. LjRoot130]|uniref:2-oxoadipate dioxygenase/decarboxylase HglS n=1 Tax=Variovorax sp. LjRoot130 TaxID=3342261 RepID=UPI003ED0FA71